MHPSEQKVRVLLDELCVRLGFCLPPTASAQIRKDPPTEITAFTEAIFLAEGLKSEESRHLRQQVRDVVSRHFISWEEAEIKQPNKASEPTATNPPPSATPPAPLAHL